MKECRGSVIFGVILSAVPVLLMSFLFIGIGFNKIVKETLYETTTELGQTITADIEKGLKTWIDDQIILAETLAADSFIVNSCLDPQNTDQYGKAAAVMKRVLEEQPYYENVIALSFHNRNRPVSIDVDGERKDIPDGSIFISAGGTHAIGLAQDKNYSQAMREGKEYYISDVYASLLSGTPIVVIAVPIKYENNLIGAVGLAPKMTYFTERFGKQSYFADSEYIFIIDDTGNMIAHPDETLVFTDKGRDVLVPYVERVKNNDFNFIRSYGGTENLYIAKKMEGYEGNKANDWYFFYRGSLNHLFQRISTIRLFLIIIITVALILSVILIIVVANKIIVKPLTRIESELNAIASGKGDLTRTLNIQSKNEVGRIALSFNKFTKNLRDMVNNIIKSVETNHSLELQLNESTKHTSSEINKIHGSINSIMNLIKNLVTQSENAGSLTHQIETNIDELTNQAHTQSMAVEESTTAIEEMFSSLKSMAETTSRNKKVSDDLLETADISNSMLNDTYNSIQQVTTNIDSIREMTDIISNIAEQTNLLAMNAAVEAAHAGEAGKGFAVVAGEIRKLAEDSSVSSRKITQEVKTIVNQIQISSSSSQELQKVMLNMISDIKGFASAFTEINLMSNEMSAGSDQILIAISAINDLCTNLSNTTKTMKIGTDDITANINTLLELTQTAKSYTDEISVSSDSILSSMSEISGNVGSLSGNTKILSGEVEQFKT